MKPSSWWIDVGKIGFGIEVLCCFDHDYALPVGTAWVIRFGTENGPVAEVLDCYVPEWARSKGVATHMLSWLREGATLHTGHGRTPAARKMMKKVGFRYGKTAGVWVAPQKKAKS